MDQSTTSESAPLGVKLCECGCGQPAPLAKKNDKRDGYVAGQPVKFIKGHHNRKPRPDPTPPPEERLCGCGCGRPTSPAAHTDKRRGHIKGQPTKFIQGHTDKSNGGKILKYSAAVGQRVGMGTVLEVNVQISRQGANCRGVRLLCDCGREFVRVTSGLFRSANPNCGCWRGTQGRLIDRDQAASMEKKKREGYF